MEMHGSISLFGAGELPVIIHKILEGDGRTMEHFFIFEAVITMSMRLTIKSATDSLVCCNFLH